MIDGATVPRQPTGFTLIELLMVISIIAVLASLLFPAISGIRNSVNKSRAMADLDAVAMAMWNYRQEDPRKRFPSASASGLHDGPLTYSRDADSVLGVLSSKYPWDGYLQRLDSDGYWIDPWERPYRMRVGGSASRPFAGFTDWNARNETTFAYLWSLGVPSGDDAADLAPSTTPAWVYRAAGK